MAETDEIYARPRHVADPNECSFYHRMEIPGYGLTSGGAWDLRDNVDAYLGGIELQNKRILEIGPASGYLTFHMESRGAEVVSVELPPGTHSELVPDVSLDLDSFIENSRKGMERVRNAYWFAHRQFGSNAKVHYGDIYALPEGLGHFDVAVIASVLLHVRDPLRVVEQCAHLADSLVITDMHYFDVPDDAPSMYLFSPRDNPVPHVWWKFSPELFVRFAEVLGFNHNVVGLHDQTYVGDGPSRPGQMFTVVSRKESPSV